MIQQSLEKLERIETRSNPFPGLRPFELHESHLFFGRDGQSELLISKLARSRFLAVVGTSGSGKSSLVRAGLLPSLLTGFMNSTGSSWRIAIMRPGNEPIGNLARALNDPEVFGSEYSENRAIQIAITEASLRRCSLGLVDVVTQNVMPTTENLLVLVDQFEEIFRYAQTAKDPLYENEAAAFVKLLLEASRQKAVNIYVVLTMRSDYLGDCSQFQELPEAINEGQYLIPRLTRDQRREAIEGPIAVAEGEVTSRLLNRLLNDVGDTPDQLPILQHALMRAWEEWENKKPEHEAVHQGRAIDLCCYDAVGGMAEALSLHADEAYKELPNDRSRLIAERLFKFLTEKGADNREIRRPGVLREACAVADANEKEVIAVIEPFRKPGRSFLMPPAEVTLVGESLIDISHESLIRNWKRLRDWVDEEARSARIYRRLAETAELHSEGKAGLWDDPDLQLALDWKEKNQPNQVWARRYDPGFETSMAFLQASEQMRTVELAEAERWQREEAEHTKRELAQAQALAEAERQKAEEQRQRLEEQKRATSKLRRLLGALILVALFALCAAVAALIAYKKSENEERKARRSLYIAQMNLAQQAWESKNIERVSELLEGQKPDRDEEDLRGFEWYYFDRLCHGDLRTFPMDGEVRAIAFSPDGQTLAAGCDDFTVRLWSPFTQQKTLTLEGHTGLINAVTFLPEGKTLATASDDKTVRLWDVATGMERAKLDPHIDAVYSVVYSPRNHVLITGSEDGTVNFWDEISLQWLAKLQARVDPIRSMALSPDGKTLALGSGVGVVEIWNVAQHQKIFQFALNNGIAAVRTVAFSPNGKMLAAGNEGGTTKMWDVANRRDVTVLRENEQPALSLAFSPNGELLATGNQNKTVTLRAMGQQRPATVFEGHRGVVRSLAFSPDGKLLATGSQDRSVKLWNVYGPENPMTLASRGGKINAIAFSADGRLIAAGGDESAQVFSISGKQEVARIGEGTSAITSLAFAPNGKTLATASVDETVRLWDSGNWSEIKLIIKDAGEFRALEFSPDGKILAGGGQAQTIRLWDAASGRELARLSGHNEAIRAIAFSHDGKILASSSSSGVKLWDVAQQRELTQIKLPSVNCIAFSPDGHDLALASDDGTVRLWDWARNYERLTLKGHADIVWSLAFSPDGKRLASGSKDKALKLWEIVNGQELATFKEHGGDVIAVRFSSNGKILATGSHDGTVKLWTVASSTR